MRRKLRDFHKLTLSHPKAIGIIHSGSVAWNESSITIAWNFMSLQRSSPAAMHVQQKTSASSQSCWSVIILVPRSEINENVKQLKRRKRTWFVRCSSKTYVLLLIWLLKLEDWVDVPPEGQLSANGRASWKWQNRGLNINHHLICNKTEIFIKNTSKAYLDLHFFNTCG